MNLFYTEHIDLSNNSGFLNKEESHHALRVLRMSKEDQFAVSEGKGVIYQAQITEIQKTKVQFKIIETLEREQFSSHLEIAVAPTKSNDRFEWFLEKATEIGIDKIHPIICKNSERKIFKNERGKRVILSAAKQSFSSNLPELSDIQSFKSFINQSKEFKGDKFIAYVDSSLDKENRIDGLKLLRESTHCLVLIGPEGDFNPSEIKEATAIGFIAISLGKKRLRTETAALVSAAAFNS